MTIDVTVIGDINVDMITHPLEGIPEKNKQLLVPYIYLNTGGCACNTAIACARLGIKTRLIGKVGDDAFSPFLLDTLRDVGVDRKIKVSKDEKTGITLALALQDSSRSFITYKGTNDTFSTKDFSPELIDGKVLIISGYNLLDSLRKEARMLFEYAKGKDMTTVLDPNWDPKGWTEDRINDINNMLKLTDFFFPDFEEGKSMTFTNDPNLITVKLLMQGPEIVCLKLGKKGCLLADETSSQLVGSFPVKPVNTTGAGDVFLAAFIKQYLEGETYKEAASFANAAAALSTTQFGLERYPTYQEVKDFMGREKYEESP
jgi:sugar/nucleoside kinase (ribokinase family)